MKITLYQKTAIEIDVQQPLFAAHQNQRNVSAFAILNDKTYIEIWDSDGLTLVKNTDLQSVRDAAVECWLSPENRIPEEKFFELLETAIQKLSLKPVLNTEPDDFENGAADADNLERWMHDKADAELREREQI